MMHDDDDEIPADLRDLFAAARGDDGPPAGAKDRVASALSITLGIGIGAAATAATSAAGATMSMGAGSGAAGAATSTVAATTVAATTVAATTTAASVAAGTGATTAAGAGFTATGGALAKGLAFMFATAVAGTTGTGIYLAAKDETKPAIVEVAARSADVPSSFDAKMLGKKAPPPPALRKPTPKVVAPVAVAPIASAPVVEIERAPIASAPVESTPEAKAERLRGERAVLDTARSAVARGDAGDALIALEAHRATYADGALVEERDALTILALAKAGRTDDARKKAEQFRAKNPHSLFLKAIDGALR